jgi:hypothetical protein
MGKQEGVDEALVQIGSTDKRVPDACGDFRLPSPRSKLRTQFDL